MSETQRAAIERNKENRSRLAVVSGSYVVAGDGLIEFPDSIEFGLAYLERPYVAVGVSFDLDDADLPDGAKPPQVTGFVSDWDQNERDFYTGAFCAAVVTWGTVVVPSSFEFYIDFTFSGIAMKDVDPQVRV